MQAVPEESGRKGKEMGVAEMGAGLVPAAGFPHPLKDQQLGTLVAPGGLCIVALLWGLPNIPIS